MAAWCKAQELVGQIPRQGQIIGGVGRSLAQAGEIWPTRGRPESDVEVEEEEEEPEEAESVGRGRGGCGGSKRARRGGGAGQAGGPEAQTRTLVRVLELRGAGPSDLSLSPAHPCRGILFRLRASGANGRYLRPLRRVAQEPPNGKFNFVENCREGYRAASLERAAQ